MVTARVCVECDPSVRAWCLGVLRERADVVRPLLLRALAESDDYEERVAAVLALVELAGDE